VRASQEIEVARRLQSRRRSPLRRIVMASVVDLAGERVEVEGPPETGDDD
jgi:hypothetical protein